MTTAITTPTTAITASHRTAMGPPEPHAPAATAGLLHLLWLASPTLPVGSFSYSEGLEAAVDAGFVHDEASTKAWLIDQLHLGLARADLAVVAQAVPAWRAGDLSRVQTLNAWVLHTRETQEMRLQTEQMGRSLLEWARALASDEHHVFNQLQAAALSPPSYPVAMACALAQSPATVADTLAAYAFAWSENMVQAALKAVPLGQSAGQRILAQLAHETPQAVATAQALGDTERQAFTPMLAILSAQHETQYSRLFRS